MELKFSQLAENLIGSEIVKLGNAIRQRIRQGETIYNFTIGDFDSNEFPIPRALEDALVQAIRSGYTTYPLADGEVELREAVAAFYRDAMGLSYEANEIQIASGGRPLIYTIFRALVNPGEKVIYALPSWNNNHYTNMVQGQACEIETGPESDFLPTAEQVEPHLKDAALICLCTPQNPTGTTLPQNQLKRICEMIVAENERRSTHEKKLYLLFDQMYWAIGFGNFQHHNPVTLVPQIRPYTLFVDGISKTFAATGLRVGWGLGPAPLIAKMKAILTHIGAWAPMAEQKAVANFLVQTQEVHQFLEHFKQGIEYRLHTIYQGILQLRNEGFAVQVISPQAAIYLTVQFNLLGKTTPNGLQITTQQQVTEYLLEAAKLAVVPFYAFGSSPQSTWYRLSVGTCKKQDIEPMLAKLRSALQALQ